MKVGRLVGARHMRHTTGASARRVADGRRARPFCGGSPPCSGLRSCRCGPATADNRMRGRNNRYQCSGRKGSYTNSRFIPSDVHLLLCCRTPDLIALFCSGLFTTGCRMIFTVGTLLLLRIFTFLLEVQSTTQAF